MDYNNIELSILNQSKENIEKVLKTREIKNIHIDIMDGYFVNNLSSITPFFLKTLNLQNYNLHLHFMVENIEHFFYYYDFLENIKYVSFHYESDFYRNGDILGFVNKLKQRNINVGLVLNPDSSIKKIDDLELFDFVLLMTVYPGKGGQKFIKSSKEKIINLRKIYNRKIMIDGGVNNDIYNDLKDIVDQFVIGSFLFK